MMPVLLCLLAFRMADISLQFMRRLGAMYAAVHEQLPVHADMVIPW
jgi:hypothetical protein